MWGPNNEYDPALHIQQNNEAMFWGLVIVGGFALIRWLLGRTR